LNHHDAKTILRLYRPGTADADDPQVAEALALARRDPELARWLEDHAARQEALLAKFRQIAIPAGLKEQIISEQKSFSRKNSRRDKIISVVAVAAIVISLLVLVPLLFPRPRAADNTLAVYKQRMAGWALLGYRMDLETNDVGPIRAYLAQHQAPSDFMLPAGLQKATLLGCAIESWRNAKASMICFHTGKSMSSGQPDLWLFVVDRAALKDPPLSGTPQMGAVNRLATAVWSEGNRVYFLGMEGDPQTLKSYL
jgi:hypothetical protein